MLYGGVDYGWGAVPDPCGGQTPTFAPSTKLTWERPGQPTIASQLLPVWVPSRPHLALGECHSVFYWDLPSVKTKRYWAVRWEADIPSRGWSVDVQMQGRKQRGGPEVKCRMFKRERTTQCLRAQDLGHRASKLRGHTGVTKSLLHCAHVKCYK